jgi:hypothetical protein
VKVLIVAELPSFYIPAVIKMNTVGVVLFLVPDGYVSIIFATRQAFKGEMAMDLTRPAVQKYFSKSRPAYTFLFTGTFPEGKGVLTAVFCFCLG